MRGFELFRWQLRTLWLVFRLIAFERLETLVAGVWWFLILVTALVVGGWTAAVLIVMGLLLHLPLRRFFVARRYGLILRGDRVEYAVPTEEGSVQRFETATVLRRMGHAQVEQNDAFAIAEPELYEGFFLVDDGSRNRVIPFEWVVSLETGELGG